jgi:hypothetical protein
MSVKRRRFKQPKPLKDRLAEEAQNLRAEAKLLPYGPVRDAVLTKARQIEAAANMDDWLNSPGLRAAEEGRYTRPELIQLDRCAALVVPASRSALPLPRSASALPEFEPNRPAGSRWRALFRQAAPLPATAFPLR